MSERFQVSFVPAAPGTLFFRVIGTKVGDANPLIAWRLSTLMSEDPDVAPVTTVSPVGVTGDVSSDGDDWAIQFPDGTFVDSAGAPYSNVDLYRKAVASSR